MDLHDAWLELKGGGNPVVDFYAVQILRDARHRLAIDREGSPALLVDFARDSAGIALPPIRLENLAVVYGVHCRFKDIRGGDDEGDFVLISCRSQDETVQREFVHSLGHLLLLLGSKPPLKVVAEQLRNLIRLFRALGGPRKESIQGIWAELFFISMSRHVATLIGAWHDRLDETFDFSQGDRRIEVKSCSGEIRRHLFGMDQLRPPAPIVVLVCSIRVKPLAGGISIAQLLQAIEKRVQGQPELALKLRGELAELLGGDLSSVDAIRFDGEVARASMLFADASQVPSIEPPVPDGVSGVHFTVDLTHLEGLGMDDLRARGGLYAAI